MHALRSVVGRSNSAAERAICRTWMDSSKAMRPALSSLCPMVSAPGRSARGSRRIQSSLWKTQTTCANQVGTLCSREMSSQAQEAKMVKWNIEKTQANYAELSPMSFLKRVERVYPEYTSIIHGTKSFTWKQTAVRCRRLASALTKRGVSRGDTVAVIASNTPEMNECHFGIPMTGAVILAINTRLDPAAVAFSLEHGEASFVITDTEFAPMVRAALALFGKEIPVVDICDSEMPHYNTADQRLSDIDYEQLLEEGDTNFAIVGPRDEWDPIALGYTSGTTGNPKGVVTHHRGAYLNALSNTVGWDLGHHPRYLWTLPMFHCNGWCFPWTLAAGVCVSVFIFATVCRCV